MSNTYFIGIIRVLLHLAIGVTCSFSHAQQDRNLGVGSKENRVALIIGNAAYKQGALTNPVNDARAMAARLRTLGFDVVLRENLKTREIGGVYREFRSKIAPGGTALVFYAGHGVQFKGQNYFPAVDSDISAEEDVPLQSINLGSLLDNMEEAKAGVSLVFLDACRDNPFARRFRSASRGLAKVEAASGTLIHYATRPGSVASDGDGKNGTYTEALLAQIGEAGIPVELMLKRVTNHVVNKTSGKQEPWVEGSLRGDFYFVFNGPTTIIVQPPFPPPSMATATPSPIAPSKRTIVQALSDMGYTRDQFTRIEPYDVDVAEALSKQGDDDSKWKLAVWYSLGVVVTADTSKAEKMFAALEQRGDKRANELMKSLK